MRSIELYIFAQFLQVANCWLVTTLFCLCQMTRRHHEVTDSKDAKTNNAGIKPSLCKYVTMSGWLSGVVVSALDFDQRS